MTIQEVIRTIDEQGGHTPFLLTFSKADGRKRDMIAIKRNKQRLAGGRSAEGSNFKYSLSQKGVFLLDELVRFQGKETQTAAGTHFKIDPVPDMYSINLSNQERKPKSVKIFSIMEFNGNQVQHV